MKTTKYSQLLQRNLQNRDFKKEYETLATEFALAKEVIELRVKRNLTQKQLAELIGTSQPAIARLESGNYQNVSLSFLRRLAAGLGAETVVHLKDVGKQKTKVGT